MRVYADTNVYVDLFEGRKQGFEDWGEFALQFFNRVKDKEYVLVISDWLFLEIKKVLGSDVHLVSLLDNFSDEQKIFVETTSVDKATARELSRNNFPDALHVVLAKKANAIYLETRNIKDFAEFRDIIKISLPQSL